MLCFLWDPRKNVEFKNMFQQVYNVKQFDLRLWDKYIEIFMLRKYDLSNNISNSI